MSYAVTADHGKGTNTFLCSSPGVALDCVSFFETKPYKAITVTAPNGATLTRAELALLVHGPEAVAA